MDRRPDLAQVTQVFSTPHPSFSRGIRSILFRNAELGNAGVLDMPAPSASPPGALWRLSTRLALVSKYPALKSIPRSTQFPQT